MRAAAGLLARCIPLAEQDSTLAAEEREVLARSYGDRAVGLLRRGFRDGPGPGLDRLRVDPDLDALRPRTDYQELLRELEEAAGTGGK